MDPFSNGTEFAIWDAENCSLCVKASRYKGEAVDGSADYTVCRCAIQRDILNRMWSNEPISQRTIDVCNKRHCPYRQEKRKKYDPHKDVPNIF